MSGFVAIINRDGRPVDGGLLRRLTDYLAFRGPDKQEVWREGPVGLGHALFQTVEDTPAEGLRHSPDGRVWIAAAARLDGRADLVRELAGRADADLREATDADLILQAYQVWGEDSPRHLLGDFAFVIWDGRRQRLFGARDHLGVRPFYYALVRDCLIISNTMNCIRRHPAVSDSLNDQAIADFLLFDYNQELATTSFADIHRLPPAHSLTWEDGSLRLRRYWTLPVTGPLRYRRQRDYVEHFRALLRQAVADRLRTGRAAVFLSGGLDSSTVAATARAMGGIQPRPLELSAFTCGYDRLIPDSERHYAGLVASHLGLPNRYLAVDDYNLYDRWDELGPRWPDPQNEPLFALRMELIEQATAHSRVILTGEGGDLLFYPSVSYFYKQLKALHLCRLAVEVGRTLICHKSLPQIGLRSGLARLLGREPPPESFPPWLNPDLVVRLDLKARWEEFKRKQPVSHPAREEAYRYLGGAFWADYLEKYYDAGVLGLPVEFRHPLLDLRLINYALALPPLPWCVDKIMLREAGRGLLPEAVRRRPKSPMADDPVLRLLERPDAVWLDCLRPREKLSRYVNYPAIIPLSKEINRANVWSSLRLHSLNRWLGYVASVNGGSKGISEAKSSGMRGEQS